MGSFVLVLLKAILIFFVDVDRGLVVSTLVKEEFLYFGGEEGMRVGG